MSGVLSTTDEQKIRDAVRLVTDSFMVTPVTYYYAGESLDRWQEDRPKSTIDYQLPCLVEYDKGRIKEATEGAVAQFDVMLSINMDNLEELNLASAPEWTVPFNSTKDYFMCQGIKYKVEWVGYDGPLSTKQCLVLIVGSVDVKHS